MAQTTVDHDDSRTDPVLAHHTHGDAVRAFVRSEDMRERLRTAVPVAVSLALLGTVLVGFALAVRGLLGLGEVLLAAG